MLLLPFKFKENRLKHVRVVQVCEKKKKKIRKKKYEEHQANFEGAYLRDG